MPHDRLGSAYTSTTFIQTIVLTKFSICLFSPLKALLNINVGNNTESNSQRHAFEGNNIMLKRLCGEMKWKICAVANLTGLPHGTGEVKSNHITCRSWWK